MDLSGKHTWLTGSLPGGSDYKESACNEGDLGGEDPLEKGMATHSSMLAWRTPWTEEPRGLQSTGSRLKRLNTHACGPGQDKNT